MCQLSGHHRHQMTFLNIMQQMTTIDGVESVNLSNLQELIIAKLAKGISICIMVIASRFISNPLGGRCIPKMDHHCPWTVNCVSHRTFPHFMRFLFYAVMSMTYLQYLLYLRVLVIWDNRDLPSVGTNFLHFVLMLSNSL